LTDNTFVYLPNSFIRFLFLKNLVFGGIKMNFPHSKKEKSNNSKNLKSETTITGLQPVEQAMNGLYGMPETDIEDKEHPKTKI